MKGMVLLPSRLLTSPSLFVGCWSPPVVDVVGEDDGSDGRTGRPSRWLSILINRTATKARAGGSSGTLEGGGGAGGAHAVE